MRVVVTGGAGFIGSHIVDALLAAGHEPIVIDDLSSGSRDNIPESVLFHQLDICDGAGVAKVFDEHQPEAVCHQAAQMSVSRSVREPVFDAQVNVIGLLNVFENACRVGAKRIVFASSGGVLYGDVYEPAGEETPAAPISPYGITKWVGEKYLQFFAREHGIQGAAMRYANVYGQRQNPHGEAGVVAIFSKRMLAGEPATVNGDGKYVRDYVHGKDVARANVLALEKDFTEPFVAFNIGTATPTDVNELAVLIRQEAIACRTKAGIEGDVPEPQHGLARAGDLRSSLVDATLARNVLGWEPERNIADGIRETVQWFAERAGS